MPAYSIRVTASCAASASKAAIFSMRMRPRTGFRMPGAASSSWPHRKASANSSGIAKRARGNGVADIRLLSQAEAVSLEPELACRGALLSPSTGIVDSHRLMLALLGDAEAHGASIAYNTPLLSADVSGPGITIEAGGNDPARLTCRVLINAAGSMRRVWRARFAGLKQEIVPQSYLAKGNYFTLAGCAPFRGSSIPFRCRAGSARI